MNSDQVPAVLTMQVIRVSHVIGEGIAPSDPVRQVSDFYAMDGGHLFRVDPYDPSETNA